MVIYIHSLIFLNTLHIYLKKKKGKGKWEMFSRQKHQLEARPRHTTARILMASHTPSLSQTPQLLFPNLRSPSSTSRPFAQPHLQRLTFLKRSAASPMGWALIPLASPHLSAAGSFHECMFLVPHKLQTPGRLSRVPPQSSGIETGAGRGPLRLRPAGGAAGQARTRAPPAPSPRCSARDRRGPCRPASARRRVARVNTRLSRR